MNTDVVRKLLNNQTQNVSRKLQIVGHSELIGECVELARKMRELRKGLGNGSMMGSNTGVGAWEGDNKVQPSGRKKGFLETLAASSWCGLFLSFSQAQEREASAQTKATVGLIQSCSGLPPWEQGWL